MDENLENHTTIIMTSADSA